MVRIDLLGTISVILCLGFSCSNVLASSVTYPARPYISNNKHYLVPGATFTLTCNCSTPGVDNYTWYFKRGLSNRTATNVSELLGQNGKNYYVKKADGSHQGLYMCKAWINGKTTRGSPTLPVTRTPDISVYGWTVSPIPEIEVLEVPSLDYVRDGWVSITLSCESPSNYPSTYVFLKDDKQVQRSNSKTYTIYDPQEEDSGAYTCAVSSTETGNIAVSDETYRLKIYSG